MSAHCKISQGKKQELQFLLPTLQIATVIWFRGFYLHLFGPMKCYMAGKKFTDDTMWAERVTDWLNSIDQKFYHTGMHSLIFQWEECVKVNGDRVEK